MTRLEASVKKKFAKILQTGITVVDFTAPWCVPCKSQEIVLKELEDIYPGKLTIQRINIDKHPDIAISLGVQSIPTLILFKEGSELHRFIGLQNLEMLLKSIKPVLDDQ